MAGAAAEQRRLATVVESWLGRPVLIVGDAMLDEWRFADSDRLCREAPAPVLTLRRRISAAGGAANTAVNVAALGGRAVLVAPVGADVAGDELHDCLDRASVWDRTVNQPGRPTPVKRRMLAGNQILLREDSGDPEDALDHEGRDPAAHRPELRHRGVARRRRWGGADPGGLRLRPGRAARAGPRVAGREPPAVRHCRAGRPRPGRLAGPRADRGHPQLRRGDPAVGPRRRYDPTDRRDRTAPGTPGRRPGRRTVRDDRRRGPRRRYAPTTPPPS